MLKYFKYEESQIFIRVGKDKKREFALKQKKKELSVLNEIYSREIFFPGRLRRKELLGVEGVKSSGNILNVKYAFCESKRRTQERNCEK